jgi:hypothetical protein
VGSGLAARIMFFHRGGRLALGPPAVGGADPVVQ